MPGAEEQQLLLEVVQSPVEIPLVALVVVLEAVLAVGPVEDLDSGIAEVVDPGTAVVVVGSLRTEPAEHIDLVARSKVGHMD